MSGKRRHQLREHLLDAPDHGAQLEVTLDGQKLEFDQGGRTVPTVAIPSAWDSPKIGDNQGGAGIAFSADPLGAATVQEARAITISRLP